MENREDVNSILPFLPLAIQSSSLIWPPQVVEALKALSNGPSHSRVDSGEVLSLAISDLRSSLSLSPFSLAPFAPEGYAVFFDELISREESTRWFGKVLPRLANLLLRFPSLLQSHYQNADNLLDGGNCSIKTGLRLLGPQEPGIVFLSQELIGALLACSFFCLFPVTNRGANRLPTINFDHLFSSLYGSYSEKQENKAHCIVHYFERICTTMPTGLVSFERKVLLMGHYSSPFAYHEADFWSKSSSLLCPFEVHSSGLIEDQSVGALEVDFANKYLGGGALHTGCVQEEIRFMINPELIAGMFFLPSMDDNEAIEIVGSERFSSYTGYASSFRFSGDYMDRTDADTFGRRKTRIVAIDAICSPRMRQYELKCLLREVNKAFCGFRHQCKYSQCEKLSPDKGYCESRPDKDNNNTSSQFMDFTSLQEAPSISTETNGSSMLNQVMGNSSERGSESLEREDNVGIATGNWGCGAFGGDPEVKTIIQWLAASQAKRPFILYYTFGSKELRNLDQVTKWVLSHEWTVGELWCMLVEYSSQRLNGKTELGLFSWLIPVLTTTRKEERCR